MIELLANIILRFECLQGEVTIDNFACIYVHPFNASYISVHPDLSRPILVRPSSENHSSSEGLRSVRMDAP